jgi:hypothetical protein
MGTFFPEAQHQSADARKFEVVISCLVGCQKKFHTRILAHLLVILFLQGSRACLVHAEVDEKFPAVVCHPDFRLWAIGEVFCPVHAGNRETFDPLQQLHGLWPVGNIQCRNLLDT